jgi:hypothetical protein
LTYKIGLCIPDKDALFTLEFMDSKTIKQNDNALMSFILVYSSIEKTAAGKLIIHPNVGFFA